jgi:hypothetical protein
MAINVLLVNDDRAHVNAHAQEHAVLGRQSRVTRHALAVDREGGPRGLGHVGKLEQHPVTVALHLAAAAGGQDLALRMRHEGTPALHGFPLVGLDQATRFHHVDEHDRPNDRG